MLLKILSLMVLFSILIQKMKFTIIKYLKKIQILMVKVREKVLIYQLKSTLENLDYLKESHIFIVNLNKEKLFLAFLK